MQDSQTIHFPPTPSGELMKRYEETFGHAVPLQATRIPGWEDLANQALQEGWPVPQWEGFWNREWDGTAGGMDRLQGQPPSSQGAESQAQTDSAGTD